MVRSNAWRGAVAALLGLVVVAVLVGSMLWLRPRSATPAAPSQDDELAGQVMLFRGSPDGDVQMCTAWGESLPPSCGGPTVEGAIDWESVGGEEHGESRWAAGVWVVGRFDSVQETFTLTRSPSLEPPAGIEPPQPVEYEFPALCDDPQAGTDAGGVNDETRFHETMQGLPGYVNSYVSDGRDFFNVIVNEDAAGAHARLREVWQGDLCVVERDLPSFAAREAATQAIFTDESLRGQLLSGGGGGLDGLIEVQTWIASDDVTARIHQLASPYVEPEWVRVTGAFTPLDD